MDTSNRIFLSTVAGFGKTAFQEFVLFSREHQVSKRVVKTNQICLYEKVTAVSAVKSVILKIRHLVVDGRQLPLSFRPVRIVISRSEGVSKRRGTVRFLFMAPNCIELKTEDM